MAATIDRRFTRDEVEQIRIEYAKARDNMEPNENIGDVDNYFAAKYNTTRATIAYMTSGKTHAHVPGPLRERPGQGKSRVDVPVEVLHGVKVVVVDKYGEVVHEYTETEAGPYTVNVIHTSTPNVDGADDWRPDIGNEPWE